MQLEHKDTVLMSHSFIIYVQKIQIENCQVYFASISDVHYIFHYSMNKYYSRGSKLLSAKT